MVSKVEARKKMEAEIDNNEAGTAEVQALTTAQIAGKLATKASNPFLDYADSDSTGYEIKGKLLKFVKDEWLVGADNTEIPFGTRMTADMDSYTVGRGRWGDGKPAEHRVRRVVDRFKVPERHELGFLDEENWDQDREGKPRDPWQQVVYLRMHAESDPDAVYTFSSSSKGGRDAAKGLCRH